MTYTNSSIKCILLLLPCLLNACVTNSYTAIDGTGKPIKRDADLIETVSDKVSKLQLKGTLNQLKQTEKTFYLQGKRVDYHFALIKGSLSNKAIVLVKGRQNSQGVLIAESIEVLSDEKNQDEIVYFNGSITKFESETNFIVNSINVVTNKNTYFENGKRSDLQLAVLVRIKGKVNASGIVLAEYIYFIK